MRHLTRDTSTIPSGRTECDYCHKVRLNQFFEVLIKISPYKHKIVKYTSCDKCRATMEPSKWMTY